jgi:hypothetical protein
MNSVHSFITTISVCLISVLHSTFFWYWIQVHKGKVCYRRGLIYLITYLVTYLLTPWNIVLLEKLNGFQLVKKFPVFYGN